MGIKITSNNQKGGITAQNVNVGDDCNSDINENKPTKRNIWKTIALIISILAGIIAVLEYLNLNPFNNGE